MEFSESLVQSDIPEEKTGVGNYYSANNYIPNKFINNEVYLNDFNQKTLDSNPLDPFDDLVLISFNENFIVFTNFMIIKIQF